MPPLPRASRALAFAEARSNALRREFAMLWLAKDGASLPPAAREPAGRFMRNMEALRARLVAAQRVVAGLKDKGPIETIAGLRPLALDSLAPAVQALEHQAQALRVQLGLAGDRPQAPHGPRQGPEGPAPLRNPLPARPAGVNPPATGPSTGRPAQASAPPAPARPGFVGMLKQLGEPAAVEALPAAGASTDPGLARGRQAFEAAYAFVQGVLEYVTPRLDVVKVALDTTGLPGRKAPWEAVAGTLRANAEAAGIPAPHLPWLPPITQLLYQDMGAVQKAHMAIVQWSDTRRLHGEADTLRRALDGLPPGPQAARLGAFDLGRYRSAVYPVSHLHVSFRGLSPLGEFFPAP
jgi:hypothetical protein